MAEPTSRPRPARITGIAHVFAAARYSAAGIARLLHEAAFRHELLALVPVLLVFWTCDASAVEYLAFGVLFALLIAFEALNTAIECLVDHVSPDWSVMARDAKDLGSLAVMCVLVCHGMLLAYVVFA